ncbi:uncharacterized protein LOC128888301 isoform X3 [Hylaeus anthracinus]|uniref:uncharacterized protein LOC128888301 isoform X3 n=1 Tax=Hylaeus anthracinus TaxID=313031 RepID=UPI0023B97F35|nr:uncharacterized protein LOC128888301 isoform X3 [Hylaeus anthracinus]
MLNCTSIQREGQCQNLNDFTEEVHQDITNITSALGWTVESIETDNDNRLVCPYNSSHRIGKEMLDQHLEFCQWKEEGYAEFDVPLSEPMLPLSSPFSMKLDASLQNSILQEAKEKDPTMKVESYECCTWHKLYISFFMSFAEYLNNIRYPLYVSSLNLYL